MTSKNMRVEFLSYLNSTLYTKFIVASPHKNTVDETINDRCLYLLYSRFFSKFYGYNMSKIDGSCSHKLELTRVDFLLR